MFLSELELLVSYFQAKPPSLFVEPSVSTPVTSHLFHYCSAYLIVVYLGELPFFCFYDQGSFVFSAMSTEQ
jgi:hypothetical protein